MATLLQKVDAELEQMDRAVRELPPLRRIRELSALELGGTAALLSAVYHGVENVLKQGLSACGQPLPTGAAWHRDLLQAGCLHGIITARLRDELAQFMAFRHFFAHAYGFELDPERLRPLVQALRPVYGRFKKAARRFARAQEGVTRVARRRGPQAGRRASSQARSR